MEDEKNVKLNHRTSAIMNGYSEVSDSRVNEDKKKKMMDEAIAAEIRVRMQEISENIVGHVNERVNDMVSEVFNKFDRSQQISNDLNNKYYDKRKLSKESILPEKQFLERNSLLTDLFNTNEHVKTVYNIFLTILILLFMNTITYDIVNDESINAGINTIRYSFGKLSSVLYIWVLMKLSTIGIYIPFYIWSHKRLDFLPSSLTLKIWDYGWLTGYVLYLIIFIILPAKAVIDEWLPIASSTIILLEQVRMLMKSYAFIRSTTPQFLKYKAHTDTKKPELPDVSKYLYFLFAPTLIYRDHYPRTKYIRWKFVLWHYLEVLLIIFYIAFLYESFVKPIYKKHGTKPMKKEEMFYNIINLSLPGILFFLCGFYCLLHAWLNACAEILRFADRLFYKDWWNSSSYSVYYRTWNVVVHDWLYAYVYKDVFEILTNQNRIIATSSVFILSALAHEYIMYFVFKFFCPAMLFMFGFVGFPLTFVTRKVGNTFLWFSLILGNGIIWGMYVIEYFGRKNCVSHPDKFLDFILPTIFYCNPRSE
ncbi:PREDICTED: sterol O-acyltransferase 1 [Polistes dominula]|uniref:O-acyltransferase n=1 Tax=Polistes dominula TaxID=743375 RepID=A0ABM1IMD8_POLDO|nr:PREDICTED: sterol O-acyltransferase 1 [Polistes dominula]